MSNDNRWSIEELLTLAWARDQGVSYPEIQKQFLPDRTLSAIRSQPKTKRYQEVEEKFRERPDIFHPASQDHPARYEFPGLGISIPADTFADIVRDYVSDGGNMTRAGIATEYGLTEDQVDHIFKVYGLTKDSSPIPREMLASMGNDEAIEYALGARERKIKEQVKSRRVRHFERKYRNLLQKYENREIVLERIDRWLRERKHMIGSAPDVSMVDGIIVPDTIHAPLADAHVGSLSWAHETGHHDDIDITTDKIRNHGAWVAACIKEKTNGNPVEKAYLTDVGDFFHAMLSQTESGTSLDKDTRDLKVWDAAFEAKIAQIEAVRPWAADIYIYTVPGNHDHIFNLLFARQLALYYRDVDSVHVEIPFAPFTGFLVGKVAHILDHGTGVGKLTGWKAKAKFPVVARIALGEDTSLEQVSRGVYYCGHKHELEVSQEDSLELRRLFALTEADDYAVKYRFKSTPGAELFWLDYEGNITSIDRFFPERFPYHE